MKGKRIAQNMGNIIGLIKHIYYVIFCAGCQADMLRRHLKTNNGEKSNKCNKCDFIYFLGQTSWGHIWKRTVKKSQTNASNATLSIFPYRHVEDSFGNAQRRKVEQMQWVWLCIFSGRPFEDTLKTHSGKKPNKCNQCDYACSDPSALRSHSKTQKHFITKGSEPVQSMWLCFPSRNPV